MTVLADRYEGKRLNSPNDLVYRSDGTLYFTDPPFGLPGSSTTRRRSSPSAASSASRDGEVDRCVTDELDGPNGLAFSPDERYLYVGNWDFERKVVMRYEVARTAGADGARLLRHDRRTGRGRDRRAQGRRGGQRLRLRPGRRSGSSRPQGEHLGMLKLPEEPHNLAWGDEDGRTLYITALTSVYRIRLEIPGIRPELARDATMSKKLKVGVTLPDFELPDENGDLHRLSELQGDNMMVLHARPRRALPARAPAAARAARVPRLVLRWRSPSS